MYVPVPFKHRLAQHRSEEARTCTCVRESQARQMQSMTRALIGEVYHLRSYDSLTVMTGTFETVGRLQIAFLPWVLLSLVMPVCPSTGGIKVSVRCKSRHCLSSQANQASGSTGRIAALKLDGNLDF